MKFSIFVVLFSIFSMDYVNGKSLPYKVLSKDELAKIAEEREAEVDSFYIIEYNKVFVTTFKDGMAILRPPVLGGEEGLFFYNKQSMNEMIESRSFPVKGTGAFWEREKERILNLNSSIPFYLANLSKLLDFDVELKDDVIYLKELSDSINAKLKNRKTSKDLSNYLAIYVGELIRKRLNGEWKLMTENTFNIYYIPEVIKGNESLDVLGLVNAELSFARYKPFDIEMILEKATQEFTPYNSSRHLQNN